MMQVVDCSRCRRRTMCPRLGRQYLDTINASYEGRDAPDCHEFEPDYRHGVEGVFAVPPDSIPNLF